jgi:predicted Zn-dependent protease
MKLYVFVCVVTEFLLFINARPISFGLSSAKQGCDEKCQLNYLIKYGYITPTISDNILDSMIETEETLKQGIMNLQREAGLEETGFMDETTTNLIQSPRCGVLFGSARRQKRFTIVRGWDTLKNNKNETMVTWYLDWSNFDQIKGNLSQEIIRTIFATSMSKWSNTSLLSLKEVLNKDEANITIEFLSGNHGDGYNFDGPGQVLAHAFYPGTGRGGDAHFDLEENWSIWGDEGISLFSVAIHEIGHSLGLGHSSVNDSVMYAWYRSEHTELHDDDKLAINSVYGIRPQYRFAPLDPKYRVYRPQTTTTTIKPTTSKFYNKPTIKNRFGFDRRTKVVTTTQKYNLDKLKKILIQNSRVVIYPKDAVLRI